MPFSLNPFAYQALGYEAAGPEYGLYTLLRDNYCKAGEVVLGSPDHLIEAAQQSEWCVYSEPQLREALDNLIKGRTGSGKRVPPVLKIDENGMVAPTENFGVEGA